MDISKKRRWRDFIFHLLKKEFFFLLRWVFILLNHILLTVLLLLTISLHRGQDWLFSIINTDGYWWTVIISTNFSSRCAFMCWTDPKIKPVCFRACCIEMEWEKKFKALLHAKKKSNSQIKTIEITVQEIAKAFMRL